MKRLFLFIMLGLSLQLHAQDTTLLNSKPKAKIVIGINFGASTLNYRPSFASEVIYGVKYKRHLFGFNYNSNELTIHDKSIELVSSKPVFNYINFGYLQQYSIFQRAKNDLAFSLGLAYAEFGVKDLSTTSFFHTGNMLNIDRLISFTPGIYYTYGILNFSAHYRYSISVNKSNLYDPSLSNGLSMMLGFRFELGK